jgi:hypothetical protein
VILFPYLSIAYEYEQIRALQTRVVTEQTVHVNMSEHLLIVNVGIASKATCLLALRRFAALLIETS